MHSCVLLVYVDQQFIETGLFKSPRQRGKLNWSSSPFILARTHTPLNENPRSSSVHSADVIEQSMDNTTEDAQSSEVDTTDDSGYTTQDHHEQIEELLRPTATPEQDAIAREILLLARSDVSAAMRLVVDKLPDKFLHYGTW